MASRDGLAAASFYSAGTPAALPHRRKVWLFDLDNTLHDATHAVFGVLSESFSEYIAEHLGVSRPEADALRSRYWQRYGATLLGLERHHGVDAGHFLDWTHRLPGLEERLRRHVPSHSVLARLRGDKYVLTNGPGAYARRVLDELGMTRHFKAVIGIEDMRMFGKLRPKPDKRMFSYLLSRLKVRPTSCTLVEDTLEHQQAAHALGIRTVWMQRYLKPPVGGYSAAGKNSANVTEAALKAAAVRRVLVHRKPAYVYARIQSLQTLRRL